MKWQVVGEKSWTRLYLPSTRVLASPLVRRWDRLRDIQSPSRNCWHGQCILSTPADQRPLNP